MIKTKKAQIQSQIFIYVFALLVISLILFFGIKSLASFKKDTEKVVLVNFVNDLKSRVASITSEYDSVEEVTLDLPKEYTTVCFLNKDASPTDYAIVNEYIGTDNNVFILKENLLEKEFNAGKIRVMDGTGSLCIDNTNGEITFILTGKGKYSEISSSSP